MSGFEVQYSTELNVSLLNTRVQVVPPLMVFEPSVAGAVESVRVDGEAAGLEVRQSGGRSVVPVQLPVDGVRTLEVVTREG